jgi:hypothetical protein
MPTVLDTLQESTIVNGVEFPDEVWILRKGRKYGMVACRVPLDGKLSQPTGFDGVAVFSTELKAVKMAESVLSEFGGYSCEKMAFEVAIEVAKAKHLSNPNVKAVCLSDNYPNLKVEDIRWIA